MPKYEFFTQYSDDMPSWAQENNEPTCTVPDQTMTIQEIIAKFTRTGLLPQSYLRQDDGGNVAAPADSDPLDDMEQVLAEARAEAERQRQEAQPEPEPAPEPSAPAGEGGQ